MMGKRKAIKLFMSRNCTSKDIEFKIKKIKTLFYQKQSPTVDKNSINSLKKKRIYIYIYEGEKKSIC